MEYKHTESHRIERIGWLRAAVLGANDGIISVASLLMGIAAAHASSMNIAITGIAALIAGAMSMAAGEYISVKSQADTENAAISREMFELKTNLPGELAELTAIYVKYGLDYELAAQVAQQLMQKDALTAHLRDELGITKTFRARPLQAALFSAVSFTLGAILPIIAAMLAPVNYLMPVLFIAAIICLALLGGLAARAGGAKIIIGAMRVAVWGTVAMLITGLIGLLLGTAL